MIHGPNIPGSYVILLFTASDLASITSHIHNWVLFLLWLHPFILSGVISPLISSSILGTCGVSLSVSYHFAFSYCSWGSQGKNTKVVCHSLLQWIRRLTLSGLVIAFLPRSNCLLIKWLQLPSTVILEPKRIKSITVSIVSPSM